MEKFQIPGRESVSAKNNLIFDKLEKGLGFVPNLYAYYAKNETALEDYLNLQNRTSTLRAKEKEVINLVVSQYNGCEYCLSAHTAMAKGHGFTSSEILKIRQASIDFDAKLDVLARFTLSSMENRGKIGRELIDDFFQLGFTEANLIDVAILIGDKTISNFIHNMAGFPIDFPIAEKLENQTV